MYYLFLPKKRYKSFIEEFEKTKKSINEGKTPVFSELRCARSNLLEVIPYYSIQGVVLILGTLLLSGIEMSDTLKIAIVLLVNSICSTVANSIFVFIKHLMRVNILKRLGLEVSEKNISVLESLEYQSV